MSDNEDWLDDDFGGESLTDFNPGNEEEDLLLADDYESGPQNVPTSIRAYNEREILIQSGDYPTHPIEDNQPLVYQPAVEPECVVPNITVEVPNQPTDHGHCTYAPYEPAYDPERTVPRAIPAGPVESPQIVPSEINQPIANVEMGRQRFIAERSPAQRMPQVRDIPDTLDKVVIPRSSFRGRPWIRSQYTRHSHPYRTNYVHRAKFNQRVSFPPPQVRPNTSQIRVENRPPIQPVIRPPTQPDFRPPVQPEIGPPIRTEVRPPIQPDIRSTVPPGIGPPNQPDVGPPTQLDARPIQTEIRPLVRPDMPPDIRIVRPELRPMRPEELPPPMLAPEISPERAPHPEFRMNPPRFFRPSMEGQFGPGRPHFEPRGLQHYRSARAPPRQEVRMLPVLPPLAGKKVLINPHFKGNFQPPLEGFPAYIPTRIQKSPPRSPPPYQTGPIKDIDEAAERFIAEQRDALARAAGRKARRSPQRYIENTTIEIENELAQNPGWGGGRGRAGEDEELLRRQEEFINANRAGLRRRMRSPSPPRRPPSPRRSPPRRPRDNDEESEYKRRVREQETLRERVLRAKELRRRRNAALSRQPPQSKEDADSRDKETTPPKSEEPLKPVPRVDQPTSSEEIKPDTTKKSPERKTELVKRAPPPAAKERTPPRDDGAEVNSTCETLTPPPPGGSPSPPPATPPLPPLRTDTDDELDLILEDIDEILSDDDDTGRFKAKSQPEPEPSKNQLDLRSKLAPRSTLTLAERKQERQKIIYNDGRGDKKNDKSPPAKPLVSSTRSEPADVVPRKIVKQENRDDDKRTFSNRRVILQRKDKPRIEINKEGLGMLSRALRRDPPDPPPPAPHAATVSNLPFGITDTRIRTLAGPQLQTLVLDKEERTAKITFKTKEAAEMFKRKFNNKMVAASRLTVALLE
uniref:Uncharacterized protein n=1 Tax=Bombyx mori TaxID=7091 RepID=A0A8R2G8W9_BOMMO|nr:titin isoform X2 [Bombyx mori]